LRDRIDPAQDLTFFCFLLGFLVIEVLRVTLGIPSIGSASLCAGSSFLGGEAAEPLDFSLVFSDDEALTGLD
jgi:hypothetical protein